MLAIHAELAGAAALSLNELAETRHELLRLLFPGVAVSHHDAASIDDRLPASNRPSVVLMKPPFAALTRDRLDRFTIGVLAPDPYYRLQNQHPDPAAWLQPSGRT